MAFPEIHLIFLHGLIAHFFLVLTTVLLSGYADLSFFLNLFIYLFLVVLGLRCCARAFSSCGERGLLFIAVHGLLIAVASLVSELRL